MAEFKKGKCQELYHNTVRARTKRDTDDWQHALKGAPQKVPMT